MNDFKSSKTVIHTKFVFQLLVNGIFFQPFLLVELKISQLGGWFSRHVKKFQRTKNNNLSQGHYFL